MKIQVEIVPDGVDEEGNPTFQSIESAIGGEMRELIRRRCEKSADDMAEEILREEVKEYAKKTFESAMTTPIQKTDCYGRPEGKPKYLVDMVTESAMEYLKRQVDKDGRDDTYSKNKSTRIEWAAENAATEIVNKAIADEISKIKGLVSMEVGKQVAEAIAKLIKGGSQ